jgi:hypothetical protein
MYERARRNKNGIDVWLVFDDNRTDFLSGKPSHFQVKPLPVSPSEAERGSLVVKSFARTVPCETNV